MRDYITRDIALTQALINGLVNEPRDKAIHSFKRMMKIIKDFVPHLLSGAKELVCYYQHGYCNYGAITELENHGFDLNVSSNLSPYFLEYLRG